MARGEKDIDAPSLYRFFSDLNGQRVSERLFKKSISQIHREESLNVKVLRNSRAISIKSNHQLTLTDFSSRFVTLADKFITI